MRSLMVLNRVSTFTRHYGKEDNSPTSKRDDDCHKTGWPSIHSFLIVGNRGETKETINETVEFLNQVMPDDVGYVGGLWIFPGTVLYQVAKKEGLIDDSIWLTDQPIRVYLAEHTQKDIRRYLYAIANRIKLGTLGFHVGYVSETLLLFAARIPIAKKIYRKIKSLRYLRYGFSGNSHLKRCAIILRVGTPGQVMDFQ